MSDKNRVYVGVRVKTTVKDLLLQHRAREANRKKQKSVNRELKELCASTLPSHHLEPPPTDVTNCSSPAPTPAAFSIPDSSWNLQMQVNMFRDVQHHQHHHHHHQQQQQQQQQHLFGDAALPNNDYSSTTRATMDYTSPLPPLPSSSPLPWCHVASTDADYYGHGMAPCSSSESLTLCYPPDPSSYSPQDSFSSSSSSCFDSPTRMDCSYGGLLSDHYPYQHHHPHQQSWADQQEGPPPTEYASFFSPTDYVYTCPLEESFFRKDSPLSSEACYNVL